MKHLALTFIGFLGAASFMGCGSKVFVDDPSCGDGLVTCDGQCVDLDFDAQNCGACGAVCNNGICDGGQCANNTCLINENLCNGVCTDINSDPNNCGGCNIVCPGGVCDLGNCTPSQIACESLLYDAAFSNVPISLNISAAVGVENEWDTSCGAGGLDAVFLFLPPTSALYHFEAFGVAGDAALEILTEKCAVVGCSSVAAGWPKPVMDVYLQADVPVYVILDDGAGSSQGTLLIDYAESGCQTCSELISNGDPSTPLCPGSEALYTDLVTCVCEGACAMQCQMLCQGGDFTNECQNCVTDTVAGCGNQFNDCANDF